MKTRNTKDRLRGRLLSFRGSTLRRNAPCGWYCGKIVRVTRGKKGGISRIVVTRPDGKRVRLFPDEWTEATPHVGPDGEQIRRLVGIRHYGALRSVEELDALLLSQEEAA